MNYIETFSGKNLYFKDPKSEDIWIGDIATSLSNLCRYVGHVPKHYSVAEHCVLGLNFLRVNDINIRKAWLLHDAAEAYVGDISSPLKKLLPDFKNIEDGIMRVINEKYGVVDNFATHSVVKFQDYCMLKTEAKLMDKNVHTWGSWIDHIPLIDGLQLMYWPAEEAERQFMIAFEELFGHGFND